MRTTLHLFAIAALVTVATACGGTDGEPMSHKLEEMETSINALSDLAGPHQLAINNASDLAAVTAEELAYGTNMDAAHEALHHVLAELAECTHEGANMDIVVMDGIIEEVEEELAAHAIAMANAPDLAAAEAEETRHQTELAVIVANIWTEHTNMTVLGDDYTCGEDHHD